jgi:hypothetical protein
MEPAPAPKQWPDRHPVQADGAQEHPPDRSSGQPHPPGDPRAHDRITPAPRSRFSTSSISSGALTSPKGPRATNTRSFPSRTCGDSDRQVSRSSRRARLRATAPPARFPATQAARGGPAPGATYSTTRSERREKPVRRTLRTSFDARSLLLGAARPARPMGRAAICASLAAAQGWPGPHGYACEHGSRASASAVECSVDRFASRGK